jgi:ligand-binding sensor domain-containing protein
MKFRALMLPIAFSVLSIDIAAFAWSAGLDRSLITFEQIPSPNYGKINAIIRDNRGFLWFGTTKGLFKYDGYRVRVFPGASPQSGLVYALLKLDDGSLLLGTGKGLWRFDPTTEQAAPFLTGTQLSESKIICVAADPTGTLWIGTGSQGLFSSNHITGKVQQYTTENGLSDNRITSLVPGHDTMLWIGTRAGGLNALNRETSHITCYRRNGFGLGSLSSNHITALCEREGLELWIGTDNGLNILDLPSGRIRRLGIHSPIKHTIMSIAADPSGRMWIAATDLGLLSYSNGKITPFRTSSDDIVSGPRRYNNNQTPPVGWHTHRCRQGVDLSEPVCESYSWRTIASTRQGGSTFPV